MEIASLPRSVRPTSRSVNLYRIVLSSPLVLRALFLCSYGRAVQNFSQKTRVVVADGADEISSPVAPVTAIKSLGLCLCPVYVLPKRVYCKGLLRSTTNPNNTIAFLGRGSSKLRLLKLGDGGGWIRGRQKNPIANVARRL
jgi:hypothetical protein